jgi:zinc and cadmium transporter
MITVLLLIASVIAGVFLGKHFGKKEKLAKNLLILSAGFLITICLNEVFPEVYTAEEGSNLGIFVIGGVLLQMVLEALTKGFEHGHFHHHSEHNILPAALMVGLFIHAFIEGIPLANEEHDFSPYLLGIVFHNLPISFILGAFLFNRKQEAKSVPSYPSMLIYLPWLHRWECFWEITSIPICSRISWRSSAVFSCIFHRSLFLKAIKTIILTG